MQRKMKNRKKCILTFSSVTLINLLLALTYYLIEIKQNEKTELTDIVVLFFFSIIVFCFFLFFSICSESLKKYSLSSIPALFFSGLAIIVFIIHIRKEPFIILPLMSANSLFAVSLYWEFLRKK